MRWSQEFSVFDGFDLFASVFIGVFMTRLQRLVAEAKRKPVLGAALYSYDPVFLEMAGHLGFAVIWIEMEHAPISFSQAADLCRMAAGTGMLTMIRIPDASRENVLRAAECSPDILNVPMADTPEVLKDLVRYSKFSPVGVRGVFGISRAMKYGVVENAIEAQQQVNRDLALFAQIETKEAFARIEEIASVPEVEIFIGPADLAASLGVPGQTAHPRVLEAAETIVRVARKHNKLVSTTCPTAEFHHWTKLGIDLLFVTNNISALKAGTQLALEAAEAAMPPSAGGPDRAEGGRV
jgi:4-hydroxy-2-oxoheptanedioate aldolase